MKVGMVTAMTSAEGGRAEFVSSIRVGDFAYYVDSDGRKIICQVTSLISNTSGVSGRFKIVDVGGSLPKVYTELFMYEKPLNAGLIYIGTDTRGKEIKLPVNPFFLHVAVTGMTQQGKSHFTIVVVEEFLKQQIPCFVLDPQGDFIKLDGFSSNAVVSEDVHFDSLLEDLKRRKTVVYNLQGLPYKAKAQKAYPLLAELMATKEREYANQVNPEIPPVITVLDEAEIFAYRYCKDTERQCKDTLVDIGKRGAKYGLGLILVSQRFPQLDLELRSQCNSAVMFHLTDVSSRNALRLLPYVGLIELEKIRNFVPGQCLLAGRLAENPITVLVRDIQTKRSKNLNFEEILGLHTPTPKLDPAMVEFHPMFHQNQTRKEDAKPHCPGCGQVLVFNTHSRMYECENSDCDVIEIKGGTLEEKNGSWELKDARVLRSGVVKHARMAEAEAKVAK
jgi:hypothetical protein